MADLEEFGRISNNTLLGIVTLVDHDFIYVWHQQFGSNELRYPRNPNVKFETGDLVRFVQNEDGRGVQNADNLATASQTLPFEIIKNPITKDVKWGIKLPIVFPPPAYKEFQQIVAKSQDINALAWNPDLGSIAVPTTIHFDYTPNVVYYGWISRIGVYSGSKAEIKRAIKTLWSVIRIGDKVSDAELISGVLSSVPWADSLPTAMPSLPISTTTQQNRRRLKSIQMESDEDENGTVSSNDSNSSSETVNDRTERMNNQKQPSCANNNHSQQKTTANLNSSSLAPSEELEEREIFYDDDLANDEAYANLIEGINEGDFHTGIIVISDEQCAFIWSPKHGYIRLDDERLKPINEHYQPSSFVQYRCYQEELLYKPAEIKSKWVAYDVKPSNAPPFPATQRMGIVLMSVTISQLHKRSSEFNGSIEPWIGPVLIPKDPRVNFDEPGLKYEARVMFWKSFVYSKWIVYALKIGGEFIPLENMPQAIQMKVNQFAEFAQYVNMNKQTNNYLKNGYGSSSLTSPTRAQDFDHFNESANFEPIRPDNNRFKGKSQFREIQAQTQKENLAPTKVYTFQNTVSELAEDLYLAYAPGEDCRKLIKGIVVGKYSLSRYALVYTYKYGVIMLRSGTPYERPPQISEQQLTNILPGSWISAALWSVAPQEENELKYSNMLVQPIALSPKDLLPETRLVNEGMVQVRVCINIMDPKQTSRLSDQFILKTGMGNVIASKDVVSKYLDLQITAWLTFIGIPEHEAYWRLLEDDNQEIQSSKIPEKYKQKQKEQQQASSSINSGCDRAHSSASSGTSSSISKKSSNITLDNEVFQNLDSASTSMTSSATTLNTMSVLNANFQKRSHPSQKDLLDLSTDLMCFDVSSNNISRIEDDTGDISSYSSSAAPSVSCLLD